MSDPKWQEWHRCVSDTEYGRMNAVTTKLLIGELDIAKQRIAELEQFMVRTAKAVGCLPSFADVVNGNEHVFDKLEKD